MDSLDTLVNGIAILFLCVFAVRELRNAYGRSADDVLYNLSIRREEDAVLKDEEQGTSDIHEEYLLMGMRTSREVLRFQLLGKLVPSIFILLVLGAKNIFFSPSAQSTVILLGLTIPLSYLVYKRVVEKKKAQFIRRIEFFLPLVMERLVMGAQAGLDIIAAIGVLSDLEKRGDEFRGENGHSIDPVSYLLSRVYLFTESGTPFERALQQVVRPIPCSALKHAFIHLSTAYVNGGELIMPLRELSDSTQTFYQESREEEIAKLPVKATVPLMCIFAGLMIVFVTSPILQILTMTGEFMSK